MVHAGIVIRIGYEHFLLAPTVCCSVSWL